MRLSPPNPINRWRRGLACAAFSLIEILVVVALLSVIILGLLAMFSQTQKVFRTGMTQTDVLEAGRMGTELVARELEQMTPCSRPWVNAFGNPLVNFYAQIPAPPTFSYVPFKQPLVGMVPSGGDPTPGRTNIIQDIFFLTRRNQEWVGIGYFVRTNQPATGRLGVSAAGAGVLYRFEARALVPGLPSGSFRDPGTLYTEYLAARGTGSLANENNTNVSRILNGVIHFQVRAFDTNAALIVDNRYTNGPIFALMSGPTLTRGEAPGEVKYYDFRSNAVPSSVELEVGIIESRVWERFKSLPTAVAQNGYLEGQGGRVHLFRQRVAIPNVDPKAYQ